MRWMCSASASPSTVAQSERLFAAARGLSVPVKMHAEQLSNLGGTLMAARIAPSPAITWSMPAPPRRSALAAAGTVAVLLPVAFYCLAEPQRPPVARAARAGTAIAVASDCNPGSAPGTSLLTRHEHGDPALRAHHRGGTARRHAPRRARPRARG